MRKARLFNFLNSERNALTLICLIGFFLYLPSYKYGFTIDFLGWLNKYESGSFSDVFISFGYDGLHPILHFFNFSFYKLFGASNLGWALVFIIAHLIAGLSIYFTTKKILIISGYKACSYIPYFVMFCFLISPYQFEVVLWKACFHYILSVILLFTAFNYLLTYLDNKALKHLFIHHILFLISLLTFEINIVSPFIFLSYVLIVRRMTHEFYFKEYLYCFFVPHLLIILTFFLANNYIIGTPVGHYGMERHLNLDPLLFASNWSKYVFKYLTLSHYFPFEFKLSFYDLLSKPIISALLVILSLLSFVLCYIRNTKIPIKFILWSMVAFSLAILPVLNLQFGTTYLFEYDRYGYFASPFIFMFIFFMIDHFFGRWSSLAAIVFAFLHLICALKMGSNGYHAGNTLHSLIESFNFDKNQDVLILSAPDQYDGMYLFRDYTGDGVSIRESLYWLSGKQFEGKIDYISQFNMFRPQDSVRVNRLNSKDIRVVTGQGGSWFIRNGIGMSSYENEHFIIEHRGWDFDLKSKTDLSNKKIIYSAGSNWRTIN